MLADRFLMNSGCLFDQQSGDLASQLGLGSAAALPDGIVRAEGRSLGQYRWTDVQVPDRRGELISQRAMEKVRLIDCERHVLDFIVTGSDVVCGEDGRVCAIDYTRQQNTWWSHEVDGRVLGLAYDLTPISVPT